MPSTEEQRNELIRLISIGQQANHYIKETDPHGPTFMQAAFMLDAYVKDRVDEMADEVVYRAFSNTNVKQVLDDLHNSTNLNFTTLEERVKELSGVKLQVTTGLISAVIITLFILVLKNSGLPIDIFSK